MPIPPVLPLNLGRWEVVTENAEVLAVHAALVPSGKVVFFGGSEHDEAPRDPAARINATRVWDPGNNRVRQAGGPAPDDLFCCGHCLLPGGEVFVAGGTERYEIHAGETHGFFHHFTGISSVIVFDWRDERWHPARPMAGGRWYPTCITLADGRVLVLSGHGSDAGPHENTLLELFQPADGTWSAPFFTSPPLEDTGGEVRILGFVGPYRPMIFYPRLHQLPDDQVFSSTALRVADVRRTRAIRVGGGTCTDLGPPPPGGDDPGNGSHIYSRSAFPSVLLPLRPPGYGARILICGERQARFFEPHNAHLGWRDAGQPRPYDARAYSNAVLLPDGTVLVVGGATSERGPFGAFGATSGGLDADAVHFAERYLPATNSWETLAASENAIARVYHSVAVLLADGRVWIAGSNHDSDRNHGGVRSDDPTKGDARELRIEVYSPPYLFTVDGRGRIVDASRPTVGALLRGAGYGQQVAVPTPQAADISAVHLVRCGSATHAFNPDQRLVVLEIVARSPDSVTVTMPPGGEVAPPGYYLLFVLDGAGTPSVGRFLQLAATYPLAEVYLGRPLTVLDVPDIPVGADVLTLPAPVLDLGTFDLGQTREAVVHCKNVGSGALRLSDPAVVGSFRTEATPDSPLSGVRGAPRNLELALWPTAQPDGIALLRLRFTPTELGSHTGTLTVNTNAPDLGAFFITLTATVVGFDVEVGPPGPAGPEVTFGQVAVGTSAVRPVRVRNRGTIDAVVDLTVEAPTPSPQFTVSFVLPDSTVPAGQSRDFPVWFWPSAVGAARASLTVLADSVPARSRYSRRIDVALSGEGTGPRVSVSPEVLTFGSQLIRTVSSPQVVTVRNVGSGLLRITSMTPGMEWVLSGPAVPVELSPGAAVDVAVAFKPALPDARGGVLLVESNEPSGPASVALEGVGVAAPIVALSPGSLAFGGQPVGTRGAPQTVTVINDGAADLHIGSVGLAGVDAADFLILADTCSGTTVPPEGTCSVTVSFRPGAPGGRSADLELVDDAGGSPRTVALAGTGNPPPVRTVDPTVLTFPGQALGSSSAPQSVTLTNNGAAPLNVAGVEIAGPAAGGFSMRHACAQGALPPGATCPIEVMFTPTAVGAREASLVFTDDAPGSPYTLPLTGTGTGAGVAFEPESLTFPGQPVGTFSERQELVVRNTGNAALTISGVSVTGDFRHDTSCGGPLGPDGYCRVRVICMPTGLGPRTGEVTVTDDAGNVHRATLNGFGAAPQASLSSASLSFGPHPIGSVSSAQSVRLTNSGDWPLIVTAVDVRGDDPEEFMTDGDGCSGKVLRHGESCSVDVRFAPENLGARSCILELTTNASDSPHSVRMSGTGRSSRLRP